MKIKKGIQIVTIFTILVIIVVGLMLYSLFGKIENNQEQMIVSQQIKDGVFELNLLTYDYLIFNNERAIVQWHLKYNSLKYLIDKEHFEEKEKQVIIEQIHKDYDNLEIVFSRIVKIDENNITEGKGSIGDNELKTSLTSQLVISTLNVISGISRLNQIHILEVESSENTVYSIFSFLIIIIMAVFSINLFLFNKQFIDPITRLNNDTKIIGSGNLDHKVSMKLDNEIGDLSRAFDSMVGNLKEITASRDELNREIAQRQKAEETIRKMNLELEEKIKERTFELQKSQDSLISLLEDVNKKSEELKQTTKELIVSKERAEESDRLKSAFLATMSHELRTPLNSILGFTGLILDGLSGPINDEQKKQLNMVHNSSKHLLSLIQDILDVSKIESGQLKVNITSFDMHKSIQTAVHTLTPLAQGKGVALHMEVEPPEIEIHSDQRRVEQIILNLLGNAIKFTEKGEVKVECHVSGGQVITRIMDTGIGIKPEHMDRLFKPFIQLDDGLSRRYEGTGLGLSICKKLVEMLGGSISARSDYGKGSVFTFTLPLKKEGT